MSLVLVVAAALTPYRVCGYSGLRLPAVLPAGRGSELVLDAAADSALVEESAEKLAGSAAALARSGGKRTDHGARQVAVTATKNASAQDQLYLVPPADMTKTNASAQDQLTPSADMTETNAATQAATPAKQLPAFVPVVKDVHRWSVTAMLGLASSRMEQLTQWHGDIFRDAVQELERIEIFAKRSRYDWIVFLSFVAGMFALDRFCLSGYVQTGGMGTHLVVLALWVSLAGIYACAVWQMCGTDTVFQWFSGYLLEWLLSVDNLFVFHVIFQNFATPEKLIHKALFWGILGAVVFRMLFFMLLHQLLGMHNVFRYVFGGLLIWSGIQAAMDTGDAEDDPTKSPLVAMLRRVIGPRLYDNYDGGRIFTKTTGVWCATLMVPVIFCLEVTDILFAVDSVTAKVAQIPDQFMNFSSSVFAMFGLRAMFFLINDAVHYFETMKYGLCFILVFIGIELAFSDYVQLPASSVCILLISVFLVCAGSSAIQQRRARFAAEEAAKEEGKNPAAAALHDGESGQAEVLERAGVGP